MSMAFYEVADFPVLASITDQIEVIRAEFLSLTEAVMPIDRVGKNHDAVIAELQAYLASGGTYGWMKGDGQAGGNASWLQYALMIHDVPVNEAILAMPKTMAILQAIQGIKVCALSKMKPNCYLPTHTHPEISSENMLQYHLTIDAATVHNFAYLNVDGEFRQNTLGASIVFDGSLQHFAVNASPADRTIVYMEFYRDRLARR